MDRLWELNGSGQKKSPRKQQSTTPRDGGAAKKPGGSSSTPKSTSRATDSLDSELAEAVERASRSSRGSSSSRASSSFIDARAVEKAVRGAEEAAEKVFEHFNQEGLSLDELHKKRVKDAARVSEHMHKPFTPDVAHRRHPTERVFRVWIPEDPNESNLLGELTDVRTVHNKDRAHIVRLIEDQLEATDKVYAIRERYLGSLTAKITAAGAAANPFASAKKDLTVLSLRMKGVEVTEYQERPERIEVHFQDVAVKWKGRHYGRPGWAASLPARAFVARVENDPLRPSVQEGINRGSPEGLTGSLGETERLGHISQALAVPMLFYCPQRVLD